MSQDELDLGILTSFSLNSGSPQESLQNLVNSLFNLPKSAENSHFVVLPPIKTRLPRQYPLPKEKVETRWEKFAREKGIEKRKKERMVFDETTQSWKPRYGYGRAVGTGNNEAPILELKSTDPDDFDPFQAASDKRKMKQSKQKLHELKNTERKQEQTKSKKRILNDESLSAPPPPPPKNNKLKNSLEKNKKVLKTVQTSTRSFGRFDDKVRNEPERKIEDKRKKFSSNIGDVNEEKNRALKILKRMADA